MQPYTHTQLRLACHQDCALVKLLWLARFASYHQCIMSLRVSCFAALLLLQMHLEALP